ncbi:porin [uncultured Hyphomicrobium sp.]|uniref:porin n=1 Tax=uncultured Hyphomicrobium sp. TaxID=194373 RepID=UPI0025F55167|nr:porin [uncultured Hyphomicrobium sp.]
MKYLTKALALAVCAAAIAAGFYLVANPANAADFGGNCCADLEQRIEELEATTARKGNPKVSLKISGQLNEALVFFDSPLGTEGSIVTNGASPSQFSFDGRGLVRPGLEAGFSLEIGVGNTFLDPFTGQLETDRDLYVRESYVFFKHEGTGKISVGRLPMATYDLAHQFGGTDAATKLLTVHPINGIAFFASNLELFNGFHADAVRYDSPVVAGFTVSAAWAADAKDIALRFAKEYEGFKFAASIGYVVDDGAGGLLAVDAEKLLLNAAVQHIKSGIFLNAAYGNIDVAGAGDTDAYHVQAGIQRTVFEYLGPTSVFAEYGTWDDAALDFYGLGLNQNVGHLDVYLSGRQYDLGGNDASVVLGGARIKF